MKCDLVYNASAINAKGAKMRIFDTKVQHLKYKVLREVARLAWNDELLDNLLDIPKMIVPGNVPTMRCCVYKERAILADRVKLAMGGDKANPNVIEVIENACDECPMGGFEVTNSCRGCLAHRCEDVCKKMPSFSTTTTSHTSTKRNASTAACAQKYAHTPPSSNEHDHAKTPVKSKPYR